MSQNDNGYALAMGHCGLGYLVLRACALIENLVLMCRRELISHNPPETLPSAAGEAQGPRRHDDYEAPMCLPTKCAQRALRAN
jgi:hypothetical protein